MNVQELSREFDILYNNITSNAAPGLNEYEKSVFLTRAQEELVIALYTGKLQNFGSFESNSELRSYLTTLTVSTNIDLVALGPTTDPNAINSNWTGKIPYYNYSIDLADAGYTNIMYFVYEAALFDEDSLNYGTLNTIDSLDVTIKTVKHTEFLSMIRNPFKRPNKRTVLRIDSNLTGTGDEAYTVELVSRNPLANYKLRYIKEPQPIILDDLTQWGLSINGISNVSECELFSTLHIKILERAVQLAANAYKSA